MRRMILAGGGSPEQAAQVDSQWLKMLEADHDLPVLYIPWAQAEHKQVAAEGWFRDTYARSLGGRAIHVAEIGARLEGLETYASIYVGGGNTQRLIDQIDAVDGRIELKNYIENGGIFYGGSAGAIILGNTLLTAPEVEPSSQNTDGLDLLDGYSVVCHYDSEDSLDASHRPLFAIPEDGGVVYDGTDIRLIGGVERFDAQPPFTPCCR